MGNSKSQITQFPVVIDPKQPDLWKTISNIGYCDIVTNIQTTQMAQSYTIPLDGRIKLQKQYQIYEYRRTQLDNLVSVFQVRKINSQYLCSGIDFLNIKTQRIHYRLNQLKQLKLDQFIYLIQTSLIGYKKIKQLSGSIKIDSNMIGVTESGQIKVWLNQNFAKNHPQLQNQFDHTISQNDTQKQMIKSLFQTTKLYQPQQIANQINSNQIQTFDNALEMIKTLSNKLGININNVRINNKKNIKEQIKQIKQMDNVIKTPISKFVGEQNEYHKKTQNTEFSVNYDSPKQETRYSYQELSLQRLNYCEQKNQLCKNEIKIKQYQFKNNNGVQMFTTYSDYKITSNEMRIINGSFGKPPRPSSKTQIPYFEQEQNKMTDSKRSSSKQSPKNYVNVQKIVPSQNPIVKSNSPLRKSSSHQKSYNITISKPDQKFPQVKPYFPSQQLSFPTSNNPIVRKSSQTFNKPSPYPTQPQVFIRNLSKQKLLKNNPSIPELNAIPYTHQSFKIQQPLFASHHSSHTNIIITDFQKKIAILNQRIDLNLYKT